MIATPSAGRRASPLVAAPVKTLQWAEEFDGPAGSVPNPANWNVSVFRPSGSGAYYTGWTHNCSLDGNSNLLLAVYNETTPDGHVPPDTLAYTGGEVTSLGKQEFTPPCKIVARMAFPWTVGLWPTFWIEGHNTNPSFPAYTGWPACGELDIGEIGLGGFPGAQGHLNVGKIGSLGTVINPQAYSATLDAVPLPRWAVYAVDWYPDHCAWSIDGQITGILTQAQVAAATGDWTPYAGNWGQYIRLSVGVGTSGGAGPPSARSTFPQTMLIDWVRVYAI